MQQVADKIGVTKQTISKWEKGTSIQESRVEQLMELFNVDNKQMIIGELKKSDELEIELNKLLDENPPQKVLKTLLSEEWGNHEYIEEIYASDVDKKSSLLQIEIERQKTLEEVLEVINTKIEFTEGNLQECVNKDANKCAIFNFVVSILKSEKVELALMLEVMTAIENAYDIDKEFDGRPLVYHLEKVFKNYEFNENTRNFTPKHNRRYEELEKTEEKIDLEKINAEDFRKVFIDTNGKINVNNQGGLASIVDVKKFTEETSKAIKGVLVLCDGIFMYKITDKNKHDYLLISEEVPKLYVKFLNDMDNDFEEITSCNFSTNNERLEATTRMMSKQTIYIYNYWFNKDGEIENSYNTINRTMLEANLD